jgi:D-aspartate ligase
MRIGKLQAQSPGAVVVGGYVNGLGLVRALAAREVRTAVVTTKPYDIAHRSRWVSAHDGVLDLEERPESLVELLERRALDWSGWALFPANDEALAALAQHRDRLASTYRVVAPPWEVASSFLDKGRMMDVARAAGVDVPHCYGPAVEATAALPELRFPVVVKPVVGYRFSSRFGTKLFAANDREELRRSISLVEDAKVSCHVFDFVPGPDDRIYTYCTYVDAHGEPLSGVTVRKLRQSPPFFGVARVAEIADDNPTLRDATVEILRRIGHRGMAAAEFKLDPRDGTFRFLEINGRSVMYNALLRRAGLDLGGLAWSDHVCGQPEPARPNGWRGVWIHLHADILYSALYRRYDRVGLADFLAPYKRPKVYAVWSATDPLPFITQWSQTAWEGASGLWRGRYRERLVDRARPLSGA